MPLNNEAVLSKNTNKNAGEDLVDNVPAISGAFQNNCHYFSGVFLNKHRKHSYTFHNILRA